MVYFLKLQNKDFIFYKGSLTPYIVCLCPHYALFDILPHLKEWAFLHDYS